MVGRSTQWALLEPSPRDVTFDLDRLGCRQDHRLSSSTEVPPTMEDRGMPRWPISDQDARDMYAGGRADQTARWYARVWSRLFRTGLLPRRWVVLEVTGRRSGRSRSFPLGMADVGGRWYLVSMLGECSWVANVRAAGGRAVLRRRRPRAVRLVEVPPTERAPILRRYVEKVPGGRPHVAVPRGSSVEAFAEVADRHPVFEVLDEGWTAGRASPRSAR